MDDKPPKIDTVVDHRIDTKIEAAKIIPSINPAASMPPDTTKEQDLRSKGQRDLNLIWETTQRNLALYVAIISNTTAAVVVLRGVFLGVSDANLVLAAFTLLSSSNFLIFGFYFGRTNHARIGDGPGKRNGTLDDR